MLIYAVTVRFVLVVLVLLDGGAGVGSCSNRRPNAGDGWPRHTAIEPTALHTVG
jgi:hypothetical protein